jgi:Fe-S oxidoreductase
VLFWVGDGAFDMRNQRTLRAFVKVLKAAKVDFAVLGLEERDSGDVARRLGDEATFQRWPNATSRPWPSTASSASSPATRTASMC